MRPISSLEPLNSAFGITSPVFSSTNTVIGTPQARWREITQSGRVSIMPRRRFWPAAGTKRVSLDGLQRQLAHGLLPLRP